MAYTVSMHHYATCTPAEFHANREYCHIREDELLIVVPVNGTTTITKMRECVLHEIYALKYSIPDGLTTAAIEAALADALPAAPGLFDASLEGAREDDEPRFARWSLQWMEWPAREA